ncbi:hypothetical protein [Saprospira grandis]|nr:hypothetical protein [Saprospira grandis]
MKKSILSLALFALLFTACTSGNNKPAIEENPQSSSTTAQETTPEETTPETSSEAKQTGEFQFVTFELLSDAAVYIFKNTEGETLEFFGNEDPNYKFAQEVPESQANMDNQGWDGNPELKGKWFKIQYQQKMAVAGNIDMPKEMANVILSAELIER